MENWGTFIKEERQKRGLSLRQLGTLAGVPYPSIFAIESGRKDPQLSTLARLLAAMGYELTAKPTRKKGNK